MLAAIPLLMASACTTGDPGASECFLPEDAGGEVDMSDPCQAAFVISYDDGSSTTFDQCVLGDASAVHDFDPVDPPELTTFDVTIQPAEHAGDACWVRIRQEEICGTGWYRGSDVTTTVTFDTTECGDVSDADEARYTATDGALQLTRLAAGCGEGLASDFEEVPSHVMGRLYFQAPGATVQGSFSVLFGNEPVDAEALTCANWEADADGDGYVNDPLAAAAQGDATSIDCDDNEATMGARGATSLLAGDYQMVSICAGSFVMGSPEGEVGRVGDQEAQVSVTLTHLFWMGQSEVTTSQFGALAGYWPSQNYDCDNCPVENVEWHEAALFANLVSTDAGLSECYTCANGWDGLTCEPSAAWATPYECPGYRLPTEAEWEYAARSGETTAFPNGGNLEEGDEWECGGSLGLDNGETLDAIAWYCGNVEETASLTDKTMDVRSLEANAWGLYDTSGNVAEWCHDWSGADLPGGSDPVGAASDPYRAFRGGSDGSLFSSFYPFGIRTAGRGPLEADRRYELLGFRLARSIP